MFFSMFVLIAGIRSVDMADGRVPDAGTRQKMVESILAAHPRGHTRVFRLQGRSKDRSNGRVNAGASYSGADGKIGEANVISAVSAPEPSAGLHSAGPKKGKIAFLFLTRGKMMLEPMWKAFFTAVRIAVPYLFAGLVRSLSFRLLHAGCRFPHYAISDNYVVARGLAAKRMRRVPAR
jgi:hypothetical protein